ncbi:MAG: MBOAT family protein [Chloroflexi bacterium]|nr:MBOAT family protein [Chloroflexota bacterium]
MLFNSQLFFVFFSVVYLLYYLLYLFAPKNRKAQNSLLLIASYYFYGSWDWRFLVLIATSTIIDFFIGHALNHTPLDFTARRKQLLAASVTVNLSILGFFKYFNFFVESLTDLFTLFGMKVNPITLQIILPVGISFYTFQTMSYTIDIYRKRLQPAKTFLDFAVFVSFFPQLVAGPIERASNLIPQFEKPRRITAEQINTGLFLILWGFFKKTAVGDNAGLIADQIFNNYTNYEGIDLFIGILAFSIQIYGDFSGYSDIARGISRLMGFELMVNFRLPYFALNPTDFWQRWHISLSSWLRDYLYIPLGGNRKGIAKTYRNLFLTMLLGGLWHGAAWNFVIWGAFHGTILILYRRFEKKPAHQDPWGGEQPYLIVIAKMLLMFALTLVGWLIFRSESVAQIVYFITHLSFASSAVTADFGKQLLFFTTPFLVVQVYQYVTRDLLVLTKLPTVARVLIYGLMGSWVLIFGIRASLEFIYFQF